MADQEAQPVSPEAFERVKRERDDLKSKLDEAALALRDFNLVDNAHKHFQGKGVPNPYNLALEAVQNIGLKGAKSEELPAKLDSWLENQKRLWGTPEVSQGSAEAATPPPPSPFQGPNPGAPGTTVIVEPMLVGGDKWKTWAQGKSGSEQIAAIRRGDAVVPEQVKQSQRTIK